MKQSKEKAKTVFGGLFGKVSMYGDKEGVVVFSGNNPQCFFDVKVRGTLSINILVCRVFRMFLCTVNTVQFTLFVFPERSFERA